MAEALGIYRVKSGKIIFHEGQSYVGGSVLGLPIDMANVHSTNIDLIPQLETAEAEPQPELETVEVETEAEPQPNNKRKNRTPLPF